AASGVQLMSLSAHKMNGPPGVGALVVDRSIELNALIQGGGQERGLRSGTENVAGIVGFGQAADLANLEQEFRYSHLKSLRDELESGLRGMAGVAILGDGVERLPNTTLLSVPGIDGETMLMNLDREGIAISSGSACASGTSQSSHVLMAMGVAPDEARCAIRISLGMQNRPQEVTAVLQAISAQVSMAGAMATAFIAPHSGV
ncbi:MAG: aminotransferase class V-fold PLP-dependent enzyme, partial [Gammaproteobacteria bacterium]|nr:aminotransferase class V-fold PLP-dependent enzyme [Gammaproteobacteria bacterium]